MKTIEERAKQAYSVEEGIESSLFAQDAIDSIQDLQLAYIKGANDQKAIDDEEYRKDMRYIATNRYELIDKMCDLMIDAVNEGLIETSDVGKLNMWLREKLK